MLTPPVPNLLGQAARYSNHLESIFILFDFVFFILSTQLLFILIPSNYGGNDEFFSRLFKKKEKVIEEVEERNFFNIQIDDIVTYNLEDYCKMKLDKPQ
jgi:hypothetical protein